MSNNEGSLGDDVTGTDHVPNEDLRREVSLGELSTAGDAGSSVSDLGAVVDDIGDLGQIVDLTERYEFQEELGQGGMGRVWKAFDRRLKRFVAIKRLNSEISNNRKALQRFLTEAQSIASLNHFHIVQIYDFGRDADGPFLILEFVEGPTLAQMLKSGPLEFEIAARLTEQMCDALALAHDRGVIHRDIKPANMLMTQNGKLKLTDFGLARQDQPDTSERTQAGVVLGTVDFMSPEQRVDASSVDARSDLWSLGATLYQMLTSRSPKVIRLNEVPEVLRAVVGRSVEDDPEDRYQSALEFNHALRDALEALTKRNRHHALLDEGQCIECGVINDTAGNFCKSCGATLLASCLQCHEPLPIWERFCTGCGENQQDILKRKREELDAVRDQAEVFRKSHMYEDALKLAQRTQLDDPRLQNSVAWITEFAAEVEAEAAQQIARRTEVLAEAQQFAEEYRYADAIRVLQTVPDGLRDDAVEELLAQCQQWDRERDELHQEIRTAVKSRQLVGLLSKARRYLELRPNNASAIALCDRLERRQEKGEARKDALLKTARTHWQEFRDRDVLDIVARIPAEFHDDEVRELAANAQGHLERAQDLGRQIEEIAERRPDSRDIKIIDAYLQLRPLDSAANELRDQFRSRQRTRRFRVLAGCGLLLLIVAAARLMSFPEAERQTGQQRGAEAIVVARGDNLEDRHSETTEVDSDADAPVTYVEAVPETEPIGPHAENSEWISLFDGSNINDWTPNGPIDGTTSPEADWTVRDGVIRSLAQGHNWLETKQRYNNFIFSCEWRFAAEYDPDRKGSANGSGIVVRSNGLNSINFDPKGIEVDLRTKQNETGTIGMGCLVTYDTSISHKIGMSPSSGNGHLALTQPYTPKPKDEWNTCEITCDGESLRVNMNGQLVNEASQLRIPAGKICLRNQKSEVEFRNLRIMPLSDSTDDSSESSMNTEATSTKKIAFVLKLNELNTTYMDAYPWLSPDGLTIFFTREGIQGKESEIWWANRPDSKSKFENMRRHSNGRHPTLTGDMREMIFLRNNALYSAALAPSGIVETSTPIGQLGFVGTPKGPALSANGQQLLFSQLQSGISRFSLVNRSTRGGQWGTVTPLPVEFDEKETTALQWPLLSEDGLTLLFCRAKNQYDTKMSEFVVSTRSAIDVPFRDVRPLLVNGQPLSGRAPRYVATTHELFYCAVPTVESDDWDLWLVRNFDLNSKSVAAASEETKPESQSRSQKETSVSTSSVKPEATRTSAAIPTVDGGIPTTQRRTLYTLLHVDKKNNSAWRALTVCDAELSNVLKNNAWRLQGPVGTGLTQTTGSNMVGLWRDNSGRQKLFLGTPPTINARHGWLGYVWKTNGPGLIKVFAMEDRGGNMQLANTTRQRDDLSKLNWVVRFSFYLYPADK